MEEAEAERERILLILERVALAPKAAKAANKIEWKWDGFKNVEARSFKRGAPYWSEGLKSIAEEPKAEILALAETARASAARVAVEAVEDALTTKVQAACRGGGRGADCLSCPLAPATAKRVVRESPGPTTMRFL